jgi:hypothetical protein
VSKEISKQLTDLAVFALKGDKVSYGFIYDLSQNISLKDNACAPFVISPILRLNKNGLSSLRDE